MIRLHCPCAGVLAGEDVVFNERIKDYREVDVWAANPVSRRPAVGFDR